uniref:Uncharacterized protein n=1 Tax=Sinocyclocheilus grahami TaxID=75366 RepID=A0A672RJZ0_SINGR
YAGRGRKRKTDVDAETVAVGEKKEKLGVDNKDEETGQRVVIEHCKSVCEALAASHPELRVVLNPQKPRRNSFEVTLFCGLALRRVLHANLSFLILLKWFLP